jgi:hypothetical protein
MITVDCREVESIKNELLVYVADQIGAIPALKIHEFMLSPIDDDGIIDSKEVITAIKEEFLDSIGESRNFAVISREEVILIKSIYGKTIERESKQITSMYSCSHCGFVTQYEVEYNNHVKIHYL